MAGPVYGKQIMLEAYDILRLVLPHGLFGWTALGCFAVSGWFGCWKRDADSAHHWLAIAWFATGVATTCAVIDAFEFLGDGPPANVVFSNAALSGIAQMLVPAVISIAMLPVIHARRRSMTSNIPVAVRLITFLAFWLAAIDLLVVFSSLLFFAIQMPQNATWW